MESFDITNSIKSIFNNAEIVDHHYKILLNNLPNQEVILSIEYLEDWNTEVGQCYEFFINNDRILIAYCISEEDFLSVFNVIYGPYITFIKNNSL